MQRILKKRDRLLRHTAQLTGLITCFVSILCLALPGAVDPSTLLRCVIIVTFLAIAHALLGLTGALRWVLLIVLLGNASILAIGTDVYRVNLASRTAIVTLGAGAIASVAIVLPVSFARLAILVMSSGITVGIVTAVTLLRGDSEEALVWTLCGWICFTLVGWWVSQSVPRVMHRIASIGRAHQAERRASEREAQRRQDARLMHDTVLATLSLLAHSGIGVSNEAMKSQAADDAKLLKQLRLGGLPKPQRSGVYQLEPDAENTFENTLESVKKRFERMGLDVQWHGSGQILLDPHVLDAFLGALGECLENVRRHAGVKDASVTISSDDSTVRAMITDSGKGFDLTAVPEERLGFAESVVGRLNEVDGKVRVFSSPGAGTTVVLEVPK